MNYNLTTSLYLVIFLNRIIEFLLHFKNGAIWNGFLCSLWVRLGAVDDQIVRGEYLTDGSIATTVTFFGFIDLRVKDEEQFPN